MRLRNAGVGARAIGDGRLRVGMPPPDPNRPVDILDIDVATVLEPSIDPIADALVDNRRDANAARLGSRFKARGNIYTVAVNIIAFDNDVA
jgi:hypothetical protein